MKQVKVFTDGACLGNPGQGGYGIILEYVKQDGTPVRKEVRDGFRKTTNNRMELLAAIVALEMIKEPCEVTLYSDSKYVTEAMKQGWAKSWKAKNWIKSDRKKAANPDLWDRMLVADSKHRVSYVWVKGHNGHIENERCDELANLAAVDVTNMSVDEIYESLEK